MNTEIRVKRIRSDKQLAKAFGIRMRVFVKEQGVPRDIELDRDDDRAIHFLAFIGDRAVGTARLVWQRGSAKIGRMAVLRRHRGRGVGKKLLKRAIETAKRSEVRGRRSEIGNQKTAQKEKTSPIGGRRVEVNARRVKSIYLHAQVAVIGFYESLGFRCVGPIFDEAGIPHRKMIFKPGSRAVPKSNFPFAGQQTRNQWVKYPVG